jgi:small-conductance mechanosensitive channel
MEELNQFVDWLRGHLGFLQTVDFWIQIGVLLVAAGFAWLVHRTWNKKSIELLSNQQKRFKQLSLKTAIRVVFPVSMLLIVSVASYVVQQLGFNNTLLRIAIPLLISLAVIRLTVYLLRKAFKPSPVLKAWENGISITIWIAVALYLVGWLPGLFKYLDSFALKFGSTRISLLSIIEVVISVGIFLAVAIWLAAFIEARIKRSTYLQRNMQVILAKIAKPLLIFFAIIISLDAVGVDLTIFTVFGGALGVGLGFGLQRIASNFISGFILIFDKSIKPGDVISLGQSFGWVKELNARYVVVKDRDGVETLIPNENLITTEVINWSYSDPSVRLKVPLQISYHDDPEKAINLMVEAAKVCPRVLEDPAPVCRLMEFGDSGITLELRVWINDPENGVSNVRTDIYLAVWKAFQQEGITIPFPQRDLHIKSTNVKLS